mmetsp:Transcript_25501/g.49631  ORF Transcript_25501/g.49631 Transcript_25501/m.49631 type:complete len:154 (+) Transcript_25501:1-462(+)
MIVNLALFDENQQYTPWAPPTPTTAAHHHASTTHHYGAAAAASWSSSRCPEELLPPSGERNVRHYIHLAKTALDFWKDGIGIRCLSLVNEMIVSSFPDNNSRPSKMQGFLKQTHELVYNTVLETVLTNQWILKDEAVKRYLVQNGVLSSAHYG